MRARPRRSLSRLSLAAVGALAIALAPRVARAEDTGGAYGRLEGDLDLGLAAGVAFAQGGPGLSAELDAAYLSTAGLYVHYLDALGNDDAAARRSIATGVLLRPLFLGRFTQNLELGPATVDLFIDSFTLEIGAFWADSSPAGGDATPGLELAVALAAPLAGEASGPFVGVRGALRWRASDFDVRSGGALVDQGAFVALTLAWHQIVSAHIVDAGDRAPR